MALCKRTRCGATQLIHSNVRIITVILDATEAQFATEDSPLIIAWSLEVQEIDATFRENRNGIAAAINPK